MKPSNEARRLHPLTLVQRMIVSLPGLIFILLPVLRGSESTAWFNMAFAFAYAVAVLPWIVLYYVRFRYWITPSELIIHSGVLTRRKRNIPIERIQNIEIEQGPMQRMMRTAKVAVYTAGSASAEGVLEYVSLEEAREIRAVVREMQQEFSGSDTQNSVLSSLDEPLGQDASTVDADLDALFSMSPKRVVLAGVFRFSWLYMAGFFSLMQYVDPDPTVVFAWLAGDNFEEWSAIIEASPWIAGILVVGGAVSLGWLSGIAVTVNRYHRFRVRLLGDKLHREHGLMTLSEGTIPLRRIQAYIIRTNPLMKRFGWYRLELQTMGIDLKQKGFQVAAPLATMEEVEGIISSLGGMTVPSEWQPVSRLTVRRFIIRNAVALGVVIASVWWWWQGIIWGVALLPLIVLLAIFRYRNMGYSVSMGELAVRKGVFRKHVWLIPTPKIQTFSLTESFFQRRLDLSTVYVDTAGASPVSAADIVDLPEEAATRLIQGVYLEFNPD
jgi:putative membrane protein